MPLLPLPRRHRRRLLLPPGLLALAWLAWLGCVALPQVRGAWVQHVMEVNFPPLKSKLNTLIKFKYHEDIFFPPYLPPAAIAAFRPWQTFTATGNVFEDYFTLHNARVVICHLSADPKRDLGLRVYLNQQVSYASLVQLLDWCNVYRMKQYWLDIQHEPTTLYVFTTKPPIAAKPKLADRATPAFICGTSSGYAYRSEPTSLLEQLTPFLTPDWRNSVLLLLLIGFFSAYRLGRGWWAR